MGCKGSYGTDRGVGAWPVAMKTDAKERALCTESHGDISGVRKTTPPQGKRKGREEGGGGGSTTVLQSSQVRVYGTPNQSAKLFGTYPFFMHFGAFRPQNYGSKTHTLNFKSTHCHSN